MPYCIKSCFVTRLFPAKTRLAEVVMECAANCREWCRILSVMWTSCACEQAMRLHLVCVMLIILMMQAVSGDDMTTTPAPQGSGSGLGGGWSWWSIMLLVLLGGALALYLFASCVDFIGNSRSRHPPAETPDRQQEGFMRLPDRERHNIIAVDLERPV